MKVYKLELMIIDPDVQTLEDAKGVIEGQRFANHAHVDVITCREAEIGEWSDDNPLNYPTTIKEEMNRLFPQEEN